MCAGRSTIRSKQEHPVGRTGGQEELKECYVTMISRKLSPAAIIFYFTFSSDSMNWWKWYRPNLQAEGHKISAYPKKLLKQIQQQLHCGGFHVSQCHSGKPTLWYRRKDEHRCMILRVIGCKLCNIITGMVNKWINTIE